MIKKNLTETEVFDLLRKIILSVTGVDEVIEADTPMGAPSGEYATLRVLQSSNGVAKGGTKEFKLADGRFKYEVRTPTSFECQINFYRGDVIRKAQKLRHCDRLPTVQGLLVINGLGWMTSSEVQNLTTLQFDRSESRAFVSVTLVGEVYINETVDPIEEVTATVADNGNDLETVTVSSSDIFKGD